MSRNSKSTDAEMITHPAFMVKGKKKNSESNPKTYYSIQEKGRDLGHNNGDASAHTTDFHALCTVVQAESELQPWELQHQLNNSNS